MKYDPKKWWECPICGSILGSALEWCAGLLLDEEDGGDTRHPPVQRPNTVGGIPT